MRKNIQAAIFAHAEREYPRECCGVIAQNPGGEILSLPQCRGHAGRALRIITGGLRRC